MSPSTLGTKCGLASLFVSAILSISMAEAPTLISQVGLKKILVLLPVKSSSHSILFSALADELLERGHYITFVTSIPLKTKHPRQREILIGNAYEARYRRLEMEFIQNSVKPTQLTLGMHERGYLQSKTLLENDVVMALKNETFDLVVTEAFVGQETLLAFGHHFGCPSMVITSIAYHLTLNMASGSSINPAYMTCMYGLARKLDTFFDRLYNTVTNVVAMMIYHLYHYPRSNALMHEAFPDAPPLYDLIKNVSLILSNSKAAFSYPVPMSQSVIPVGGFHIKPGKPLPENLKKWIEDSKDGVVYFSLGTNLHMNLISAEMQKAILLSLGKLKQRVLLKWDGGIAEKPSENCRFEEWIPQQEVLAHPNVLLFLTHGGLLSALEAVHFGVPMIGISVFGDQHMNMALAAEKGVGIPLPLHELTTEALDAALSEILNNPKYRENSKKLSMVFRSDPMTSHETAVYYTELLMKFKSLKHLQPISLNLAWYQYLLVDVVAFIALSLYVSWKIMYWLCRSSLKLLYTSKVKTN